MRKIGNKFHVDGDKIIKTTNGEVVPKEEPLFLVRGRDRLALALLRHYELLSQADGCSNLHMDGVKATILDFKDFRNRHPRRMKQPTMDR